MARPPLSLTAYLSLLLPLARMRLSPNGRSFSILKDNPRVPQDLIPGLTTLWELVDDAEHGFNREAVIRRTAKHLAGGYPERVKAELELLGFAQSRIDEALRSHTWSGPPPTPREADFADFADFDDARGELESYREVEAALKRMRRSARAQQAALSQALDLWALGINPATLAGETTLFEGLTSQQRLYLAAFRYLARREVYEIQQSADEPLVDLKDPLAPERMAAFVTRLARFAMEDGRVSKAALYKRIAERAPGTTEDAEVPGDKVRTALERRFGPRDMPIRITGGDKLEATLAKLLLMVLTLDAFEPNWTAEADKT